MIMLLPDNMNPNLSVYYNSSILLSILSEYQSLPILDLYQQAKEQNDVSFATFILCLDWLYLIESAQVLEDGSVKLCTLKN